jgi:hypothetical protein
MCAGQLESQWPVRQVAIQRDGTLRVKAGRLLSMAGGLFVYDLDPKTGSILGKAREFTPSGGVFADPTQGYSIWEGIAIGEEARFGEQRRESTPAAVRKNVKPVVTQDSYGIHIRFGASGSPVGTVKLVSVNGRLLISHSGPFTSSLTLPRKGLPRGQYVLTVEVGNEKIVRKVH